MFYNQVSLLCKSNSVSISKVAATLGLSKSNVTRWKEGVVPKSDTVKKIAEYFNVSTDFLIGNVQYENSPGMYPHKEQTAPSQPLFTAEDMELLLKIKSLSSDSRKEVESHIRFKQSEESVKKELSATLAI